MPRGLSRVDAPTLHDENWRDFNLDKEANSRHAMRDWRRYRAGLTRLRGRYWRRVPRLPLIRALAEDAFFCAAHWKKSPEIVRRALREFLMCEIDAKTYTFAAAEFWKWAAAVSSRDLPAAQEMLGQARRAMPALAEEERDNLNRMLEVVVGRSTPPSPSTKKR